MKKATCVLLLAVLSLVLCDADGGADAVASADANTTNTNIPVTNSVANNRASPQFGEEKKTDDLGKGSQEGTKKHHKKESSDEKKYKTLVEPKAKDSNGNQSLDGGSNSAKLPLEEFPVEGCDPSNRCFDEKNKFSACLRVPGNDILYPSLLIQNEGTKAIEVKISAPDFVDLEKTLVNLQAKKNGEVKVFVKDGASDTTITLNAVDGNCSLNLRNMIPTSVRSETSRMARYFSLSSHTFSISLFLAAVVLVGAAWLCIRFWQTYSKSVPRYQKVDMVLPVSTGGNKETDDEDGWDNSWGDGWDDEAPKTPSKPVSTPSSKGLASRRLIKDGWKD